MIIGRVFLAIAASTLLCACNPFRKSDMEICHRPQEYQSAASVAPLKVPAGLDAPNVQGALVIPTLDSPPPPPGPRDPCLDDPPRYKPPQAVKPGGAAPPPPPPAPADAPAAAPASPPPPPNGGI